MAPGMPNPHGQYGQLGQFGPPNQFGTQQGIFGSSSLTGSTRPIYRGFEFVKPKRGRDYLEGERATWEMVTGANELQTSSAQIEMRVKKKRNSSKKTVLDEWSELGDQPMKNLVSNLVNRLNLTEPDPAKVWEMALIEAEKRETIVGGRQVVREFATLRVFVKQDTRPEVREMVKANLRRSSSLSGSIDVTPVRGLTAFNQGYNQNPAAFYNAMAMPMPNSQPYGVAQGMMPNMGMQQGYNGMQGGNGFGQQYPPPPNNPGPQNSGGAGWGNNNNFAQKPPGKSGGNGVGNANGTPAIKNVTNINSGGAKKSGKKGGSNKRSKSRSRSRSRKGAGSGSSDSDSDSGSSGSSSDSDNFKKNMKKGMNRLTKNLHEMKVNGNRRRNSSTRLPHPPMGRERRDGGYSTGHHQQRHRTSPIDIPRRGPRVIERVIIADSDTSSKYSDGYISGGSRNSWLGGDSAFTPPSSYDSYSRVGNMPTGYREHRKPSGYGRYSPALSLDGSGYDDHRPRRRGSKKYLQERNTDFNDYYGVPPKRSGSRRDDYRRQAEVAGDYIKSNRRRADHDRHVHDPYYHQYGRSY